MHIPSPPGSCNRHCSQRAPAPFESDPAWILWFLDTDHVLSIESPTGSAPRDVPFTGLLPATSESAEGVCAARPTVTRLGRYEGGVTMACVLRSDSRETPDFRPGLALNCVAHKGVEMSIVHRDLAFELARVADRPLCPTASQMTGAGDVPVEFVDGMVVKDEKDLARRMVLIVRRGYDALDSLAEDESYFVSHGRFLGSSGNFSHGFFCEHGSHAYFGTLPWGCDNGRPTIGAPRCHRVPRSFLHDYWRLAGPEHGYADGDAAAYAGHRTAGCVAQAAGRASVPDGGVGVSDAGWGGAVLRAGDEGRAGEMVGVETSLSGAVSLLFAFWWWRWRERRQR